MNTAVLDVGKTHVRVALLGDAGETLALQQRRNTVESGVYPHFDVDGLFSWMLGALRRLAAEHGVDAIVPVTHGACAALLRGDALALPVLDYEYGGPESCEDYDRRAARFAETGSPRLPAGLNLGRQLDWQARAFPDAFRTAERLLPYPQYWAWRLSGVAACEVTSLGCHTDLWCPARNAPSEYARASGLARLLPERVDAWSALGAPTPPLRERTGLSPACRVLAGIHDSNASFLTHRAARDGPFAVVSTGTWFVVMARGGKASELREERDMLLNVDALGEPLPTARFAGGREAAAIRGGATPEARAADVLELVEAGARILPGFSELGGPFRTRRGAILGLAEPDARQRAALAALYAALMTDLCLDFVGARGDVIVEGRFARDDAYVATLSALRAPDALRVSADETGTLAGAALLARWPDAALAAGPTVVAPDASAVPRLREHREEWRARCGG